MVKESLTLPNADRLLHVSEGSGKLRISMVERITGVKATARGSEVTLEGEASLVAQVKIALNALSSAAVSGESVDRTDLRAVLQLAVQGKAQQVSDLFSMKLTVSSRRTIGPKSLNQAHYINAMKNRGVVVAVGPAGTGKTYLAMAMALSQLHSHKVERIILTRPAVEAGERLGYLPGDLEEKVHPYLRPLYDALYDMLGVEGARRLIERQVIEIAPLAFMRGRTLNSAFIILDEAQNTTPEQMKMFLTRLGVESEAVVCGDVTQIDLPRVAESGLLVAREILKNVDGITFIDFNEFDVVRHELVQAILSAYERYEVRKRAKENGE